MSFDSASLYAAIMNGQVDRVDSMIRDISRPCEAECCVKALIGRDCAPDLIRQALDQFVSIHAVSRHGCWVKHAGYLLPVLWDKQLVAYISIIHNIVFQSQEETSGTYKFRVLQAAFAVAQNPVLDREYDLDDLGLSEEALRWLDFDEYQDIQRWIKTGKMPAKPKTDQEQK